MAFFIDNIITTITKINITTIPMRLNKHMFDIPISIANKIYVFSNAILVVGAVMALLGTIGVIWSGGIRNKFSDERISFNESETAKAKAESANANERAANVEKNNLELKTILEKERIERLNLEEKVSPRRLTTEMQDKLAIILSPFHGKKILVKSYALDVESAVLGTQIIKSLKAANIIVTNNLLSQSSLGSVSLGVHVTGKNKALVEDILKSFFSVGDLAVFREPIPQGTGIYTGIDNESDMDTIIFVGAKPIQQ